MAIRRPFNLQKWITDNRDLLKPPVGNKNLYAEAGDFIVMIVGGPNARKDYHWNVTEELYYQLEGDVTVKIQEDGNAVEIPIRQGEMFLLPGSVPHCPIRPADTWGLVIERKRRPDELDRLAWFCERCGGKLHEATFSCANIEVELRDVIQTFNASAKLRTCAKCRAVLPVPAGAAARD